MPCRLLCSVNFSNLLTMSLPLAFSRTTAGETSAVTFQPCESHVTVTPLFTLCSAAMESLFDYLWDMGIIEYLICILALQNYTHAQRFEVISVRGLPRQHVLLRTVPTLPYHVQLHLYLLSVMLAYSLG